MNTPPSFAAKDLRDALNFSTYFDPTGECFLAFVRFSPRIAICLRITDYTFLHIVFTHDTFHDQPCINPNRKAFRVLLESF
jgi:hypothetical protein